MTAFAFFYGGVLDFPLHGIAIYSMDGWENKSTKYKMNKGKTGKMMNERKKKRTGNGLAK